MGNPLPKRLSGIAPYICGEAATTTLNPESRDA